MTKIKTWSDTREELIKKLKEERGEHVQPKYSHTTLKAHWIDVSDTTTDNGGWDWHIRDYMCDNCGNLIRAYHGPSYCNGCGARMVKNDQ